MRRNGRLFLPLCLLVLVAGALAAVLVSSRSETRGSTAGARTAPAASPATTPTAPPTYAISGHVRVALHPGGREQPINVTFRSRHRSAGAHGPDGTRVSILAVAVRGVSGPNIARSRPCDASDFAITQFRGGYPLTVPYRPSSLQSLGYAVSTWPTIRLIDTASNQDGCKDATVELSFTGTP